VKKILQYGTVKKDRTGTGTISLFGPQMEFELQEGFPLLTTKKLPFRVIAEEDFWFISGSTSLRALLDRNVHIWDADAYRWHRTLNPQSTMSEERFFALVSGGTSDFLGLGDLGPIYGKQWRNWNGIDQLGEVIDQIKENPDSRRLIVNAWNVDDIPDMALPPCHVMYQFYVENNRLSCKMYQRSADMFLGVPFNIASYALLTHLVAKMTGLEVGRLIHTIGDAHIYLNHVDQLKLQLTRSPKRMPILNVKTVHENIEDYTFDDLELIGYDPHPVIKGKVSVGN
jgi:thymidylate synthase